MECYARVDWIGSGSVIWYKPRTGQIALYQKLSKMA